MAIEHDLIGDELARFDHLLRARKGSSHSWSWYGDGPRHAWIRMADGEIVEARADKRRVWMSDTQEFREIDVPTTAIVRRVFEAEKERAEAQHERRVKGAKRATITRQKRRERLVYEAAQALCEQRLTARDHCRICGRTLSDPESVQRGIGSECWQDVLAQVQQFNTDGYLGWTLRALRG